MRALNPSRFVAAIVAVTFCFAPVWAALPAQPAQRAPVVAAVWVPRHVQFIYRGYTTLYTCSGLQNEVDHLLIQLGARDVRVKECGVIDRLILFPSARVTMRVLVPAGHGKTGPTVAAHWRKVMLFPSMNESDGCELVREFRHTFLPLFEARDIDMSATCVPHHYVPGTHLYVEVLAADSPAAKLR